MEPMRLDPEDYAFLASYSPARVGKQTARLGSALLALLISWAISVGFLVYWWFRMDKPKPQDSLTTTLLVLDGVTMVVTLAAAVIALIASRRVSHGVGLVLHFVVLGAAVLPLVAVFRIWFRLHDLDAGVRVLSWFVSGLSWWSVALWGSLCLLLLVTAAWAAAVILGIVWALRPREIGWLARQFAAVSVVVIPGLIALVTIAGFVVKKRLGDATWLTSFVPWFGGLSLWALVSFLGITYILLALAVLRVSQMMTFTSRLVDRPALRVDPLGLVIDEASGPVRVRWGEVREVGAKAHTPLPGPELWLRRTNGTEWRVPFGFLDCLPGTIDSAIRAHTGDQRTLDVSRLSRIW